MARKRVQRPTTYDKIIDRLCQLHNCNKSEATNIYKRKMAFRLLPE